MSERSGKTLRVMLPTDDSPSAQVAEAWVTRLRWLVTPSVDVVTVASRGLSRLGWSLEGDGLAVRDALDALRQGERSAADRISNEVGERLQLAGLTARTWARQGDTREELLAHIEAELPDLVVIGTRGRSAVVTMLLGSVSQDLVEYSPCPILVARAVEDADGSLPRHVVVPVDGSLRAEGVVAWLEETGWLEDARITLAGLLGERAGLEWDEPVLVEDVARAVREDAAATLERIAAPLVDRRHDVNVALVEGHPMQGTFDTATARGADLIAVARGLRRPGADPFAEKVARYAPVSTLVVPVV
jgi:nucleotide-binding universal stress UspA family protein